MTPVFPDLSAYTARCSSCQAAVVPGVNAKPVDTRRAMGPVCDRCENAQTQARVLADQAFAQAARLAREQPAYPPLGYTPREVPANDAVARVIGVLVLLGLCLAFGAMRECGSRSRHSEAVPEPVGRLGALAALSILVLSTTGCERRDTIRGRVTGHTAREPGEWVVKSRFGTTRCGGEIGVRHFLSITRDDDGGIDGRSTLPVGIDDYERIPDDAHIEAVLVTRDIRPSPPRGCPDTERVVESIRILGAAPTKSR